MTSLPRELCVDAGGLRFRALEWPGTGPLVLLLHAASFCADAWRPAWDAARASGASSFRAVAVDLRGHGRSAAPAGPDSYAWDRFADDAVALLGALRAPGDPPGLLVGHSCGATAALVATARRPDAVAAVALVEPVLFEAALPGADADSFAGSRAMAARASARRAAFASRDDARVALGRRFPFSGFAPAALEAFLDGGLAPVEGGVALRCAPSVESWTYSGAAALDPWREVRRLERPALLLRAEHTGVPERQARRLAERCSELRVERVPGATHFAPLEQPDRVGAALGAFVRELAGRSG